MPVILFICTANRYRSPISAAYFNRKLVEIPQPEHWVAISAGTWTKSGYPADPMALVDSQLLGLNLASHSSQEVNANLVSHAQLVVVMEKGQKEAIRQEFAIARSKTFTLSELAGSPFGDIPDPYDDGVVSSQVADELVKMIDNAYQTILERARKNLFSPTL